MNKQRMIRHANFLKVLLWLAAALMTFVTVVGFYIVFFASAKDPSVYITVPAPNGLALFSWHTSAAAGQVLPLSQRIADYASLLMATIPLALCFFYAGRFFDGLAQGQPPFSSQLLVHLKKSNLWLYLEVLLTTFLTPVVTALLTDEVNFVLAFTPELLIAIILTVAIEIFQYGASLQAEVDETV